ncbi:MAG: bifunctional isocitrate dehydrogenase kinase/phosphatase [Deltaproteobacteria bacterium]|nr:bifunctional isocitrate dehydrogenase kinase/phosphatase [Deltaproteobacteria bacterium]
MPVGDESGQAHAAMVLTAYERYAWGFLEITRRARERFERRAWRDLQADTRERLDLYQRVVDGVLAQVGVRAGSDPAARLAWRSAKHCFQELVRRREDAALAETFFNSVVRRVLGTVGVDEETEFSASGIPEPPASRRGGGRPIDQRYAPRGSLVALLQQVLADTGFALAELEADAARTAAELERVLAERDAAAVERVDVLVEPFFRGQAAYLIGRIWAGEQPLPLVIALLNLEEGIRVDAVLLDAREVGAIFSLSRSYFFHAQPAVRATVQFLEPLIKKPRSEIYTALGHKRHGKTELFRHLRRRLAELPQERFVNAPGVRGLVMIVFTMPSLDLVFKVIRDRPGQPKDTSPDEVRRRYRLVFQHDRVGRLLDAQEFEHLRLPRSCFSQELLAQLLAEAPQTVTVDGDAVVLGHAYAER